VRKTHGNDVDEPIDPDVTAHYRPRDSGEGVSTASQTKSLPARAAVKLAVEQLSHESTASPGRLLREGVVMGAVTTERTPVPGCRVQPLGLMRYIPVASKSYMKRYLPEGFTGHAVSEAPSLARNRDDTLQDELVRKAFRRHIARRQHFVPTAEGFGAVVRAGLGWGMFPDSLAAPHLGDGSFVRISDVHLDVPLFWQCWKLNSPLVQTVTDAMGTAAAGLQAPSKSQDRTCPLSLRR
jgi:ArgP family transcriptional regulator